MARCKAKFLNHPLFYLFPVASKFPPVCLSANHLFFCTISCFSIRSRNETVFITWAVYCFICVIISTSWKIWKSAQMSEATIVFLIRPNEWSNNCFFNQPKWVKQQFFFKSAQMKETFCLICQNETNNNYFKSAQNERINTN